MKRYQIYLTCLLILVPAIIVLLYHYIGSSGHILFHDVTEGINSDNIFSRYFFGYNDNLGSTLVELSRIPIFSIIWIIFKSLFLTTEFFIKIKIFLLYITSICAFLYSIHVFSAYIKNTVQTKYLILAGVIASLVYIVNPWMNNRIVHFFLFFASVNIPLVTSLYFDLLHNYKISVSRLIILIITFGITLATPHIILIDFVIIFGLTLRFLMQRDNFKNKLIRILKIFLFVGIPVILISLYWLLPYLSSGAEIPDRAESLDILLLLSRNASLINSLRLISYWWINPHVYFDGNSVITAIQIVISYMLPGLFLMVMIILRKNKLMQTLFILFLISLFLSSNTALSLIFYKAIMFDSFLSSFGWLLREIDKFGIILAYIYSVSLYFLILVMIEKSKVMFSFILIFVLLIFGFNFKHLNYVFTTDFKPSIVPNDFQQVNDFLTSDNSDCNVVWYPGVGKSYWAQTDDNPYTFTQLSSSQPIANTNSSTRYYINYLFDERNIDQISLGKALDLIGVKYVIIRDDDANISQINLINKLNLNSDFKLIFETQIIKVFENQKYSGLSDSFTNQIKTNLGYEFLKYLDELNINPAQTYINFVDSIDSSLIELPVKQYILENGDYSDIVMSNYNSQFIYPFDYSNRAQPNQAWAKGSLTDLTHAETGYYLNERNIHNAQLDFGNGIIMAYDQYQLKNHQTIDQVKGIPINNIKFPNVTYANNSIAYDFNPITEQNPYWKIIRSNKIELKSINNAKALSVFGDVDVSYDVNVTQPHLKITFYDESDNQISTEHLTPDDIQMINTYFKIPVNTVSFDISLWSATLKIPYTVTWNTLNIKDITNYVEPISLSIPIDKNQCQVNCYLITRSLKSQQGGEVEYLVNNKSYIDNTISNYNRFTWTNLGIVDHAESIAIINRSGFNAINTLTLVSIPDYESTVLQIKDSIKDNQSVVSIYNADSALPITNDNRGIFLGLGTNDLDVSINLISEKPIEITYKTHSISPFIESTPTISQIVTTLNIQQTITSNESVAQFPSVIIKQGTVSNSEITASISESKINPTKHQITLDSFSTSNLPSLLTFKKPFSPNWRLTELNNQKPVVAYGLVNGWFVNQLPLSAAIEYLPQQYFYIGSIISLITLGVIIVIWTIVRRKKFPNKLF